MATWTVPQWRRVVNVFPDFGYEEFNCKAFVSGFHFDGRPEMMKFIFDVGADDMYPDVGEGSYLIWVALKGDRKERVASWCHELVHVWRRVADQSGMEQPVDEECEAYYHDCLTQQLIHHGGL